MKLKLTIGQKKNLGLAILLVLWFIIHEFSHYLVCTTSGSGGVMNLRYFKPTVYCPRILEKRMIVQFIYYSMPYIMDLLIVLLLIGITIKKINISPYLHALPYVAALDSAGNFYLSVFNSTDFHQIAGLSTNHLYFSYFIVLSVILGSALYFKRNDYDSVRNFITKRAK